MPGVLPVLRQGPATYQVFSAVTGGQVVVPHEAAGVFTDQTIIPNVTVNAINVLGVAANDAAPYVDQTGLNPVVISQQPDRVAVYYGVDITVAYAAACDFGICVSASAASGVQAYVRQGAAYSQFVGDPVYIIGRCSEPGGVAAAGNARARIGAKP